MNAEMSSPLEKLLQEVMERSIWIKYDYSYCWGSLTPRYPYLKFNDLCGIVICDHSIVTDSRVDGLLQNYRHGEPPYWYAEGSIFLCALHPSGIPYGLRFAMEEFDEMIEDQDYLKLKPYIREVVNRTIHSLRPIANDLRKWLQTLCYHNEIK